MSEIGCYACHGPCCKKQIKRSVRQCRPLVLRGPQAHLNFSSSSTDFPPPGLDRPPQEPIRRSQAQIQTGGPLFLHFSQFPVACERLEFSNFLGRFDRQVVFSGFSRRLWRRPRHAEEETPPLLGASPQPMSFTLRKVRTFGVFFARLAIEKAGCHGIFSQ